MGRWLGAALAGLFLVGGLGGGVYGQVGGQSGSTPASVDRVLDPLEQAHVEVLAGEPQAAEDHVEAARDRFDRLTAELPANETRPVRDALDRVAEAVANETTDGPAVRTAIVGFEARMLALAASTARDHLEAGQLSASSPWIEGIAAHIDAPGRQLPPAVVNGTIDPTASDHSRQAALDSLLAARVIEEVAAAEMLELQGAPRADLHADRAGILWLQVGSRLASILSPGAADRLDERLPELALHLDEVEAGGGNLAPITGPLTAVAYHRSIDRLEGITATIEGGLFLAHRTLDADREHAQRIGEAAVSHYQNYRANYLRHGEGGLQASDAAFADVHRALTEDAQAWADALRGAVDTLHTNSALDHGMRFIVRAGQLEANTTTQVPLGWTNSGLEGVSSYRVELGYDPARVNVTAVETGWPPENATVEREPGRVVVGGGADEAAFGRTLVAKLAVTARVAEGTIEIEVVESTFETPGGHREVLASVEGAQLSVGDAGTQALGASEGGGHHGGDAHDHGSHDHGDGPAEPTSVQDAGGGSDGGLGGGLGALAGGLAFLAAAAAFVVWWRRP